MIDLETAGATHFWLHTVTQTDIQPAQIMGTQSVTCIVKLKYKAFYSLSLSPLCVCVCVCLDELPPTLTEIVNNSLLSGYFPSVLKMSLLNLFYRNLLLTRTISRTIAPYQICLYCSKSLKNLFSSNFLQSWTPTVCFARPSLLIVHAIVVKQHYWKWPMTFCMLWIVEICVLIFLQHSIPLITPSSCKDWKCCVASLEPPWCGLSRNCQIERRL